MEELTWILIGVGGLAGLCLLISVCIYCKRRNRRAFTNFEDVSNKLWVGHNPTAYVPPAPVTPEVVVRDPGMDDLNRKFDRMAGNYCRSLEHERVVKDMLFEIGLSKGKCLSLVDDVKVNFNQRQSVLVAMSIVCGPKSTMASTRKKKKTSDEGPVKLTSSRVSKYIIDVIANVRHPNVLVALHAGFSKDKKALYVTRPWSNEGSIRDYLYGVRNPKLTYQQKYPSLRDRAASNSGRQMKLNMVQKYGAQVLAGLKYLAGLGVPYFSLHSGNVILFNGVCKLTDYENAFFGYRNYYHNIIKKHAGNPYVTSFGLLLFEMANGYKLPLKGNVSITCSRKGFGEVNDLLVHIFHEHSKLTLDELIAHPLFASFGTPTSPRTKDDPDYVIVEKPAIESKLLQPTMEYYMEKLYPNCQRMADKEESKSSSSSSGSGSGSDSSSDSDEQPRAITDKSGAAKKAKPVKNSDEDWMFQGSGSGSDSDLF